MDEDYEQLKKQIFCTDEITLNRKSFWNSYETVLKILKLRGYKFEQEYKSQEDLNIPRSELSIIGHKSEDENDPYGKILVVWFNAKVVEDLKVLVERLDNERIANAIVITQSNYSSQNIAKLANYLNTRSTGKDDSFNITLQLFMESELQFFLFDHENMPKYTVLAKEEKLAVCKSFGCSDEKFKKIRLGQMVCRLLGVVDKKVMLKIECDSYVMHGKKDIQYRVSTKGVLKKKTSKKNTA